MENNYKYSFLIKADEARRNTIVELNNKIIPVLSKISDKIKEESLIGNWSISFNLLEYNLENKYMRRIVRVLTEFGYQVREFSNSQGLSRMEVIWS